MSIKTFIGSIIGKTLAKKLDLKEGSMDDKKKWWQSKTVLAAVVTVVIGLYNSLAVTLAPAIGWNLPAIPEWVYAVLGGLGVYSRVTATKTIG